ncbi:MAG: hypothetical protein LRY67_02115 [Gammaproteobacteria bacterium]|nr:hypothetical protein [Gammaproteobacteria bacterium]MCD8543098.1 hypothetical protein [Gammaproteobacteria bacterium]
MSRSLSEWIHYLHTQHSPQREFSVLSLMMERLAIKKPQCPVISVAGTNGKGSVVSFLESYYVRLRCSVAAYTSPYLLSFNEQFRVNQQSISDCLLCHYFEKIERVRGELALTFFDVKTLAALLYFADSAPDVMLLEVGLGGRLDSVNMIDADIAVITSIGLDHCDRLGNTREEIAREKVGIFRRRKLAVCGDACPPDSMLAAACSLETRVFYRGRDFDIIEKGCRWSWCSRDRCIDNLSHSFLLKDNIATALQVAELLAEQYPSLLAWDQRVLRETISTATVLGRQHVISEQPWIAVDVSHNEDSVRRLVDFLKQHDKISVKAVFSVLKTKDFSMIARVISPYIREWHIAPIQHPDAMSIEEMQRILDRIEARSVVHVSIKAAYDYVCATSTLPILVFGSFHVVGQVLDIARAL